MRLPAALAVALLLPLAGCLSDPAAPPAAGEEPTQPPVQAEPLHPEGTPEFCESESDSGLAPPFDRPCDFWDEDFHEYVVYDLDTTVIDVVILPSAGPDAVGSAASRMSVQAWEDGIRAYAAPWFNASFEMNVYMVGQDVPSLDAVVDPEVVVLSTGLLGIFGIGAEPKQMLCQSIGEGGEALRVYPEHRHGDVLVQAADCTGAGFVCYAINVGGTDLNALYDLIAHEVGHCLGAGHVGDALDFRARYAPVEDIMSYQNDPAQVHCVSTLNVRVLEGVYAHLLDQPEETWLPAGSFLPMSPLDYEQVECPNP
jgi:hypothetical protein